jgi:hypothetical protein
MRLLLHLLLYAMALFGPLAALGFLEELRRKKPTLLRTATPFAAMFAYGWLAFMGQALAAWGVLSWLEPTFEWPIWSTGGAMVDSLGRSYVPLTNAGRIQVYDATGTFLHGWFVPAHGGDFHLHLTDGDTVNVYTARGSAHLVYTGDGELISESRYSEGSYGELPARPHNDIDVSSPWWLLPLAHPVFGWVLTVIGVGGLIVHRLLTEGTTQPGNAADCVQPSA